MGDVLGAIVEVHRLVSCSYHDMDETCYSLMFSGGDRLILK